MSDCISICAGATKDGIMFRSLVALGLVFTVGVAWAQRPLSSPDLSTFTTGGIPSFSVDASGRWIYVSGFKTRAMGLPRRGVVRVTTDGVIDGTWQTTGISEVFSHLGTKNGDLYVHGWETMSGPKVVARYTSISGGQAVTVYRGDGIANNPNTGIGAIYGGRGRWIYFTNNNSADVRLRRIDTSTGEIDATWSYYSPNRLYTLVEGADDALFALEEQPTGINREVYVKHIDSGVSSTVLWWRTFRPGQADIAVDASGRVYVMTRDPYPATTTAMHRLDSTGHDDPLWNGASAAIALSQSRWNRRIAVVGDALLMPVYIDPTATAAGRALVLRFDQNGVEAARWEPGLDVKIDSVSVQRDGRVYVKVTDDLQVLDAATLRPVRTLPLGFGSMGTINSITVLPDGGRLFLGRFSVWYNGQRFQNVLRTRADGTPDTEWRVDVDGYRRAATITSFGVLLTGDFTRVNGVSRRGAALISLSSGATVSSWVPSASLGFEKFAVDDQNTLYFVNVSIAGTAILRLSMITGQVDANWRIDVDERPGIYPGQLEWDQAGGLWLFREDAEQYFGTTIKSSLVQRFSIADRKQTFADIISLSTQYPRAFVATKEHVYINRNRYRLVDGGQLDTTWQLDSRFGVQAQARDYFYYPRYDAAAASLIMQRVALSGKGNIDTTWSPSPQPLSGCPGGVQIPLVVRAGNVPMDDAEFLVRCNDDLPMGLFENSPGAMTLFTSRNEVEPDTIVIEYLNRAANRYFMTGRAQEQALLDALPGTFARTGMRFAAKGSLYSDMPEATVCRLYSPPSAGGSNTHFYGTGDDCPALNTVRQLRFEGFDFAAIKPTNGSCPTNAPNPVYRLFNNRAANNDGNHRYVVSAATKSKMIAQGWLDEGVVFCSTNVVDAAN